MPKRWATTSWDGTTTTSLHWESFPTPTLEQVYGAITFDLANQTTLDVYLREGEKLSHELQAEWRRRNADLITHLRRARHVSQISG